jgi:hypothetical protein
MEANVAPKGLSQGRVDWSKIGEVDFNQLVEVLLLKMYDKKPYRAEVLRGDGGDGGIDVAVWLGSRVIKIFQLKYFPEGFTGEFRKVRRPQVEKSFKAAWKNHTPSEWILVMPPGPHKNERDFVLGLATDKAVEVDIWGQEKLAAALTDYPEVERAFLRDELVDVLRQINQEKAGLVGNTDLTERVEDLMSLANTRSKYWDTTITTEGGVVFEDYVPKHPDAMEKEPILTQLTFNFGPEHSDVAEQLQEQLDYGLLRTLDLPGKAVSLTRTGPAWVAPMPQMTLETVRLSPAALEKSQNKLLTMNIVDNFGFTKGRYEGRILRAAHGPRGAQLLCELMNVLTMTFKLPRKGVGNTPECKLSFSSSGASVRDVHGAISLLDSFRSGCKFELYAAGGRLATIGVDNVQDAPLVTDEWTRELVEDLYVIEQALHTVSFSVPDETTHLERIGIRIARLLLEGYQTVMPPGQAMSMTLNGEIDDALKLLLLEGSAVFATQPTTALEILGHKYDMGPGFVYHPRVKVIDGERIWKLLESGEGAGVKVKLAPIDDTPFRVWVQRDAKGRSEEHPPFRPWGVPGIGDPQIGDEPAPNAHP